MPRDGFLAIGMGLVLLMGPTLRAGGGIKSDAERLQGAWEASKLEYACNPATPEETKGFRIQVEGDRLAFSTLGGGRVDATLKLDPKSSPGAIDLTIADGPAKGRTVLGVYAFDGDDLKLCIREVPQLGGRPKGFDIKSESGAFLATLKRAR